MPQSVIEKLVGVTPDGERPLLVGAPPPVLWTPSLLPDLQGHWVPETLADTAGTIIDELASEGGISNTLVQTTADRYPLVADLSGKKAMYFDGANDEIKMQGGGHITNGGNAITFFMRYKLDAIATDNALKCFALFPGTTVAVTRLYFGLENLAGGTKRIGFSYRNTDAGSSVFAWSTTVADLNEHVIVAHFDRTITPTNLSIWLDGVSIMNSNTVYSAGAWDAVDSFTPYIGSRGSTNNAMNGRISNVGVLDVPLNTTNRRLIEGYLAHWGTTIALPGDHPYVDEPPYLE